MRQPQNQTKPCKWLRQTVTYYARFTPDASRYVETAFNELYAIRVKHGDEVDNIVREAYEELKGVTGKGMTVQTAQEVCISPLMSYSAAEQDKTFVPIKLNDCIDGLEANLVIFRRGISYKNI